MTMDSRNIGKYNTSHMHTQLTWNEENWTQNIRNINTIHNSPHYLSISLYFSQIILITNVHVISLPAIIPAKQG